MKIGKVVLQLELEELTIILPLHASVLWDHELNREAVTSGPSVGARTFLEVDQLTKG